MATNDKYDRQLRLWGAAGQRALGETTIVLVNATASGTETLKNLGKLGCSCVRGHVRAACALHLAFICFLCVSEPHIHECY